MRIKHSSQLFSYAMASNWIRSITKFGWLAMSMMALLPWLSACADNTQLPTPPLTLPFEVQRTGSKVETELFVVDHREYSFSLKFGFKENDGEDRARVKKLVGDDGQFKNGDPGISTPLRIKINLIDASGDKPLFEQEISVLRLRSWGGNGFDKHIAYVVLKPGHYRVSVESLKDVPELVGTPIAFGIGFYAKATPIK